MHTTRQWPFVCILCRLYGPTSLILEESSVPVITANRTVSRGAVAVREAAPAAAPATKCPEQRAAESRESIYYERQRMGGKGQRVLLLDELWEESDWTEGSLSSQMAKRQTAPAAHSPHGEARVASCESRYCTLVSRSGQRPAASQ